MRLSPLTLLAVGVLSVPSPIFLGAEASAEGSCCLEVTPAYHAPRTFLVNVTARTNVAKRNQNALPVAVVFPDAYTVSDDLTMRPFGDVKCSRRSNPPAGSSGGNASRNW